MIRAASIPRSSSMTMGRLHFQSNRAMTYDKDRAIFQSELDIKTGKRLTEPKALWRGSGGSYIEGPHL
jgi:alpha-N-arabinofuranosidase